MRWLWASVIAGLLAFPTRANTFNLSIVGDIYTEYGTVSIDTTTGLLTSVNVAISINSPGGPYLDPPPYLFGFSDSRYSIPGHYTAVSPTQYQYIDLPPATETYDLSSQSYFFTFGFNDSAWKSQLGFSLASGLAFGSYLTDEGMGLPYCPNIVSGSGNGVISETAPVPATFTLFIGGLSMLGLFGWYRSRIW